MPAARPHTRPGRSSGGVEIQLPWWAIALPAVVFAALLLLIAGPGDAHAASDQGAVPQFFAVLQSALAHLTA